MPYRTPDASQHTRYVKDSVNVTSVANDGVVSMMRSRNSYVSGITTLFARTILPNHISSNKFTEAAKALPCPENILCDGGGAGSNFCNSLDGNGNTKYDGGDAYKQVCT